MPPAGARRPGAHGVRGERRSSSHAPAPRRSLRPDGPEVGFVNAAVASARAPCCLGCLPAARQGGLRAPVVSSAVPPPPSERRLPRLLPSSFRGVCSGLPLPVCSFARRRRSRDGQIGTRSALPHAPPVLAGCLARDGWPVRICISSSSPKWRFRGPRQGRIWGVLLPVASQKSARTELRLCRQVPRGAGRRC